MRFVRPETTVLHISNGDTLTVKRRLSAGEQRTYFARMSTDAKDGLRVNALQTGLAIITAYLVDWSITDGDGPDAKLVAIRGLSADDLAAVLDNLDPDDFREIRQAVDAHDEAMAAERAAQKKTTPGGTGSSPTSTSPAAAGGGTSGSPISTETSTTSSSRS